MTVATLSPLPIILNGCDNSTTTKPEIKPEPVAQTKKLIGVTTLEGSVDVNINYMALPDSTPGYLSTLEIVVRTVLSSMITNGNLTIEVIDGDGNFVLIGANTLTAGENWLSNATEREIGINLTQVSSSWVAMHNTNDTVRMANAVPQYNRAMQLRDNRIASKLVRQRMG